MSDSLRESDDLEPGGYADRFIRSTNAAAANLVHLMSPADTSEIEEKLDALNERLDLLNEKLDNFVKVLASLPTRD